MTLADDAETSEYACPECGAPVDPAWKACPNCGVEFAGPEEEAAAPAPAPPAEEPAGAPAPPPAAAPRGEPRMTNRPAGRAGRGPIARIGLVGIAGLLVLVVGLGGVVAAYNYDTLIAGQTENVIGPNQLMAIYGAAAVASVGAGLFAMTLIPLVRARGARPAEFGAMVAEVPEAVREEAAAAAVAPAYEQRPAEPAPAPAWEREPFVVPVPPVAVAEEAEEAPVEAEAPPAAVEVEEAEEEEEAIELPAAAPQVEAAAPPEPTAEAAAAPAGPKDELDDLFGELESEVASAVDEDVHYECPSCHGIVREDDASCPHCHVVFEG